MTGLEDLGSSAQEADTHRATARSVLADKAVAWLLKMQARSMDNDRGPGYQSAREVGLALGLSKAFARRLLNDLAIAGRVLRCEFANGVQWRSVNPVFYETPAVVAHALATSVLAARTANSVGMKPEGRNAPSLPTGDA
jgi:hypothetical protein